MRILKTLFFLLLIFPAISCKREVSVRLTRGSCYNQELGETVICGTFEVLENRDAGRGRKFKLNFIILPARTSTPAPDPVFVFTGGPGCSAVQEAASWAQDLDRLCLEDAVTQFISQGSAANLDFRCADNNQRPPWISWRDFPTENLEKLRAEIKARFPGTRHH